MTVDEEFNKLEDDLRRLKIEYEVYFNGGSPRPPHDTLYRVENTIKRYSSDQSKLNFGQRFRFTSLVQKYAVNSQLWRRKLQEKEEGRSLTGPQKRHGGIAGGRWHGARGLLGPGRGNGKGHPTSASDEGGQDAGWGERSAALTPPPSINSSKKRPSR